jgi:hypothetical protein
MGRAGRGGALPSSRRALPGGARSGQGRPGPLASATRRSGADDRRALLGGARPRQVGPTSSAHCRVGTGRGRAGLGRPGAAGVEPGWPVRGEQAGERRRVGRTGKNEKMGGIHKLGAFVPRSGRET